jgi:hypothetical protein
MRVRTRIVCLALLRRLTLALLSNQSLAPRAYLIALTSHQRAGPSAQYLAQ